MEAIISDAICEMNEKGITGKLSTPFLLSKVVEKTQGSSLDANIELVLNNARLGAQIAIQYSQLHRK